MKTVREFPRHVQELENVWIPLSDGTRLAARIWLPEGAESAPVPAILEYIPYRKRDMTRERDDQNHPYFAGHGYASVRVDLRGSGDSDGILADEYLQQELDDGAEVIRWLARQSWCNGNVGMIGISWGGFNGLQVAALQPPELKAVITVCSTDDRYADDVHHMGGCLLGDNLSWASVMFAYNSCPPDPAIVGDRWRDMWLRRLDGSGLWLEKWLRHQNRDEYWKHGSICEDYSSVRCPVYAVSGWADGYTNAVFRMLANLDVPRKGLIGPWSHKYPHLGKPGPAIGFLQEALRWWDHWLKGVDTGVMDEPMLRVWMQDSVPPTTMYKFRPGRWVGEESWPSTNIETRRMPLAPRKLEEPGTRVTEEPMTIRSPLSVGLFAGKWCSYTAPPDLPHDQREEDGGALIFDSEPLSEDLEILGAPVMELDLVSDQPVAMVAVRLSDVAADGKATRNTYGLLNLTHRESHEHPQPLDPGQRYRVRLQLNDIAQSFPAGHRLRVSISTSYWPLAWPPPEPVQLTVYAGTSYFLLPVRPASEVDGILRGFEEPEVGPSTPMTMLQLEDHRWTVIRDLAGDVSTLEVINDEGTYRIEPTETEVQRRTNEWYSFENDNFHSPRGETYCIRAFRRGDWAVKTVTRTVLTCDADNFHIRAELDAYEEDTRVFSKNWNTSIPRNLV
ncbi:CocE/NonD family hydrolase [Thiohalorhabdus sp. Cl-TMA]|uniref:CocE/NonD family hydrolase n=1 Tax=Thiohalorhabdus methylotrophus TaxID=3242694 RepID=A0ABV4TZU9_9GAMM